MARESWLDDRHGNLADAAKVPMPAPKRGRCGSSEQPTGGVNPSAWRVLPGRVVSSTNQEESNHAQSRREQIREAIERGELDNVPDSILCDELSPGVREMVARLHPTYMGGEYLPGYKPSEVEITRVVLASATQDVMSVRACPNSGRIRYRVEDEYETQYRVRPQTTKQPLTLGGLIKLMDTVTRSGGDITGLVIGVWEATPDMDPDDSRGFIRVESEFYPELARWYEECEAEFFERLARLKRGGE